MSASNKVPENLNYLSNVSFRLTMEDAPHMTWFCQAANIPGVSIDAIEVFNPTATIPVAGSRVSFEELSVRFIVDEHMKNWTEIYDRIIALGLAEGQEKFRKSNRKGWYSFHYCSHTFDKCNESSNGVSLFRCISNQCIIY